VSELPPVPEEAVRHQVKHRLARLRELSFDELAALPAWRTEDVEFGPRLAAVTVYRDVAPDGALEIVVQCMPDGAATGIIWRGVYAEGFWIWPNGRTVPLPEDRRYYYM
jgi:hypothetical protein